MASVVPQHLCIWLTLSYLAGAKVTLATIKYPRKNFGQGLRRSKLILQISLLTMRRCFAGTYRCHRWNI